MPRLAAWRILRSGDGLSLRKVETAAAKAGLDARGRALVRRLVGCEARRRATLRALIRAFATTSLDPDVAAHLRIGLVQIFFLDGVPDHAAVSETVEAARATVGERAARIVNALLRAGVSARRAGASGDPRRDLVGRALHLAEPVFHDPREHPFLWAEDALSMPAGLFRRWTARCGEARALALARDALEEPTLSVRAVGTGRPEAEAELAALGIAPRRAGHPDVLLAAPGDTATVIRSDAFAAGRITIQGESALRAAELLQARAGERLLDLAAAPGGKTAVLAQSGASVVACDVSSSRLERLAETLARLGLAERVVVRTSDGTQGLEPGEFDGVLVDAPCSNTGVLAQRPAARWRYGPSSRASLCALQARLLAEGAARVRPGGRLVYSTCSLEPEENVRLVRSFVEQHPGWRVEESLESQPDLRTGPIDGGFAARLVRD